MCASVCPSEALWHTTQAPSSSSTPSLPRSQLIRHFQLGRQEVRTEVYTVVDDLEAGPLDVVGTTRLSWLDDPFGLADGRGADLETRSSPYEAAAEEAVTRREFARSSSCSAPERWPRPTSASRCGRSCGRSTPASRARSSSLDDVAVGDTYSFEYPAEDDPAVLLARRRPCRSWRSARSARTSDASCTTKPTRTDGTRPCHEGNFDTLTGAVLDGPPPRALGRIDVEIRDDGQIWALGATES